MKYPVNNVISHPHLNSSERNAVDLYNAELCCNLIEQQCAYPHLSLMSLVLRMCMCACVRVSAEKRSHKRNILLYFFYYKKKDLSHKCQHATQIKASGSLPLPHYPLFA